MDCMTTPMLIDVGALVQDSKSFASQGNIDPLANLHRHRIWLYSGTYDTIVNPGVMQKLEDYYQAVATNANITTVFDEPSAHTYPTLNYGGDCQLEMSPFVGKCNYDAAGALLNWIYPGLVRPTQRYNPDNAMNFSQGAFVDGDPEDIGLDSIGWVYVPTACQKGKTLCKLHIAFHGCTQSYVNVGDAFYGHAGYNDWAEANNIIVIYPQAHTIILWNPNGCFDWWGFTSSAYAFKSGEQMTAVHKMMQSAMGTSD